MGVPTSEVGYTPAMPRREDHEVHKDMWWHWTKKNFVSKRRERITQYGGVILQKNGIAGTNIKLRKHKF